MSMSAVAWDVDGTLVDSEPVHLLALQQVCLEHGVDICDLPAEQFIGVHVHDVWCALAPRFGRQMSASQWVMELDHHYLRNAASLAPMPGALAVVAELSRRGVRQVAVSNSNHVVVQANLAMEELMTYMSFALSLEDVSAGKPDPAPYALAARRLALPPAQILAIEDSVTGLLSAKRAGLRAIGYGANPALAAIADRCIGHLRAVLDEFDQKVADGVQH